MAIPELKILYNLLVSFLGEAKNGFDGEEMQLQFPCPRCAEKHGSNEKNKYNLEVNMQKQVFQCWKCCSTDEDMKGSIIKLIKNYGNEEILSAWKETIRSMRESEMYKLHFSQTDFNLHDQNIVTDDNLTLPQTYSLFRYGKWYPEKAMDYLRKRGVGWDIIKEFRMGFTTYDPNDKKMSNRIILPSFNKFGELNYWTGRDFTGNEKRQKYFNPKVERKNVIFNEEKIQWEADVTLCEGPFDYCILPNAIPLLGKVLDESFSLYWELIKKAKANVNIFLDGDAVETANKVADVLKHTPLAEKVRMVYVNEKYDPSLIYQEGGKRAIISCLRNAVKI